MLKPGAVPLSDLAFRLANQAIDIQTIWDEEYRCELEEAAASAGAWALIFGAQGRDLLPARSRGSSFSFEVGLLAAIDRETGFEVKVVPLNLGFAVRHRVSHETEARLRVEVEQIPAGSFGVESE